MLICPQCQRENPNTNKFCQGCGTSLTQKVCAECSTKTALSEKRCPNCDAEMGPVWMAIISVAKDSELGTRVPQQESALENSKFEPHSKSLSESPHLQLLASNRSFLDQQQRYQLLEPLPLLPEIAASKEVQVRVLDCQPFQLSPLDVDGDSATTIEMPAIAKTYLALQSKLQEKIPAIHDAWQQEGMEVVLVTDRSNWLKLLDLWQDKKTPSSQILQWLFEMAQLWAALEPWHCRQSLLELPNLRVDQGGVLGMQRLYAEPPVTEQTLTLQDLGQLWQRLFQESQRTKLGSLFELIADLQTGKIQTLDQLRSRLQAIIDELQTNVTLTLKLPPALTVVNSNADAAKEEDTATITTINNSTVPSILPMDEQDSQMNSEDLSPTVVLPMQLVNLEDAGSTDVGRQRNHNEDCFGIETAINKVEFPDSLTLQARGIYILCDGMGGHAGGEVASRLAVKTLQQYFQTYWQPQMSLPTAETIRQAVRSANQAIYDLNQQDARSGIGRMGTTLVIVLVQNNQVAVAHVGDSRLYRYSCLKGLEQVTLDHEVGQREILRGVEPEIAYARPDAYQLTQALGPRDENFVNPDVQFFELNEDTLLLLASDGLTDYDLIEHHWQTHLQPLLSSATSLQRGVKDLVELANQHNGHDNITAVVVRAKVRRKMEQKQ